MSKKKSKQAIGTKSVRSRKAVESKRKHPRKGRSGAFDSRLSKPALREGLIRLRRVRGHLEKVIQMVEDERPCTDILQQLSAVLSALGGCRSILFAGHLKTCLRPALKGGNETLIDEVEKLVSRVMKVS